MLEVTSNILRPNYNQVYKYSASNADALIVTMRPGGQYLKGLNINYYTASISLYIGGNSMFAHDNYYYFGSYSWGYKTKLNNVTYNIVTPTYDSHLFRIDPDTKVQCFYQDEFSGSDLQSLSTRYTYSQIAEKKNERYLLKKMSNLYLAYSSKYSGSFDLSDTLKYPKMCMDYSYNMTDGVTYYRGQNEFAYVIGEKSKGATGVNMMDDGGTWMFQNGTNAVGLLGRWTKARQGTIYIQTDSQEAEGTRRTILRGCSRFDKIAELYLYVKVLKNTYPDFETEIETSWTLSVGQEFKYQLPQLKDEEGNDEPELYINKMPDQEYPPFLAYENDTQTLIFTPHSIWYQGKTYYFRIVVKEKNSETVSYPYYCTVKISGVKIDPEEYFNFTDVTFSMGPINRYGQGSVIWSHPVNLTFVKEHWFEMFDVYIKNVTFRDHNTTMKVKDFFFTELSENNTVMQYNATFYEPYKLGLLQKKHDKLYVHLKYDLLDTKGYFRKQYRYLDDMFFGNKSLIRMYHDKCLLDLEAETSSVWGSTTNREKLFDSKRIPLQFDFTNNE